MRIAILGKYIDADQNMRQMVEKIIQSRPNDSFYLFLPTGFIFLKIFPNLTIIPQVPVTENKFLLTLWLRYKLPFLLGKINADLIIGYNGFGSFVKKTPQLMLINDLFFEQAPLALAKKRRKLAHSILANPAVQFSQIAFTTESGKQKATQLFGLRSEKATVISSAVHTVYNPPNWEEQEAALQQFTNGKSFFLYKNGSWKETEKQLKAFSLFKKRQQSSMLLVIIAKPHELVFLQEKLSTYVLRNEVLVKTDLTEDEKKLLIPAAYALLHPQQTQCFPAWVMEAMNAGVPAILDQSAVYYEIFDEAALYISSSEPELIAEQMKILYKDEYLRKRLINAWQQKKNTYAWKNSVEKIGQLVDQAITKA